IDGQWKAFRTDEVFSLWGGEDQVATLCNACPANVYSAGDLLAGCHGWLTPVGDLPWSGRIEKVLDDRLRHDIREDFLQTQPVWYGLWADGVLNQRQLQIVQQVFDQWTVHCDVEYEEVTTLRRGIEVCLQHDLPLDVQLLPPGNSDGLNWIIQPHCDRCLAPFLPLQPGCLVCEKAGMGHPAIKRRVLGLRPWVDLHRVIGESNVSQFLKRFDLGNQP
ncbi:MAG: hypothetical protein ACR2NP_01660, partial [Pirellulaceae bacterium]